MAIFRWVKRKWLAGKVFPEHEERLLASKVPVYHRLPARLQGLLKERMTIFLNEKRFEGCGGLQITKEIKIVIAAYACVLILEQASDYYPDLQSILVYPDDYIAPVYHETEGGIIIEGTEHRKGEYWNAGSIVLSWKDICRDLYEDKTGNNLIYHEFSHFLDHRYGLTAGCSEEGGVLRDDRWTRVLSSSYRKLRKKAKAGRQTAIDDYGTSHPSEFFAVSTEAFFEKPESLKRDFPGLYKMFISFYGTDPLRWRK